LGLRLIKGRGVQRNEEKGRNLLIQAAKIGSKFCSLQIATYYQNGTNTFQYSISESNSYLKLSDKQSYSDEEYLLDLV
jgi:TPR repeat protein